LTKINQPLVPQFLMSGAQGQENNGGLIPTAMLSSMFGRMMPDALEKLKEEAPKTKPRGNGYAAAYVNGQTTGCTAQQKKPRFCRAVSSKVLLLFALPLGAIPSRRGWPSSAASAQARAVPGQGHRGCGGLD
jgi:hypothetical protein